MRPACFIKFPSFYPVVCTCRVFFYPQRPECTTRCLHRGERDRKQILGAKSAGAFAANNMRASCKTNFVPIQAPAVLFMGCKQRKKRLLMQTPRPFCPIAAGCSYSRARAMTLIATCVANLAPRHRRSPAVSLQINLGLNKLPFIISFLFALQGF